MSSRKRRISHDNILQENPSKRARLLSELWKAKGVVEEDEEEAEGDQNKSIAVDTASSQDSVRLNQKEAEAISGEGEQENIANWQYFPYNKKRRPNHNPKELIDESEIANWTQGVPIAEQRKTLAISRKHIREKSVEQRSDRTVPIKIVKSISSTTSPPCKDKNILSCPPKSGCEKGSISSAQAILLPPVGSHEFAIKIPQYNSLDKGQYIRYQSLSSTQGYSSNSYCQSLGLGDSTSLSGGSISVVDSIIPDSQSLPGSSSYVPTTSTSLGVTSSNWSDQDHSHAHTAQTVTELGTESSDLHDFEGTSLIDNTTSLFGTDLALISISEGPISGSQTSLTLSRNFSSEAAVRTHLSPTQSNLNFRIAARAATGHAGFSVLEIPESNTQSSGIGRSLDTNDRESIPQAITPEPRFLESQVTETSSSVEENWQSGQVLSIAAESLSYTSSKSSDRISVPLVPLREKNRAKLRDTSVRRRTAASESFIISEDQTDSTHTSQTTEESVLSQRNSNSQVGRQSRQDKAQDETTKRLTGSAFLDPENTSDPLFQNDLQQRTRSDLKMSEKAPQVSSPSEGPSRNAPSGPPTQTLREKLLNLRAAGRASRVIKEPVSDQEEVSRAVSSPLPSPLTVDPPVPSETSRIEVQPLRVTVGLPLPVRAVQSQPHTPAFPSRLAKAYSFSQRDISLKPVNLGESEYIIPLPMNTRVRDQYISTINFYRKTIEDCMKAEEPDAQLKAGISNLLSRVNAVTTHVDLDCKAILSNGRYTLGEGEESPADEARWAENCSAKFQFLGYLIEASRDLDVLITIVATSDHLRDIIKTFLTGKEVAYTCEDTEMQPDPRSSRSDRPVTRGKFAVALVSSKGDVSSVSRRRANLVIAFDVHFNVKSRKVMTLREDHDGRSKGSQLVPVIHLLVYGSGEHIERCLPNDLDSWARVKHIVSYITQTRHRVGQLVPDDIGPRVLAEEVTEFLKAGGQEKDWALPGIRAIDGLEVIEPNNFESSSSHTAQASDQSNLEENMGRTTPSAKRSIDTGAKTSASKKQKNVLTDVIHLSESMLETQPTEMNKDELIARLRHELKDALMDVDAEKLSHKSDRAGLVLYQREIEDKLAAEKKAHERTEKERAEIVASLSDLQTRMEDKIRKFRTLRDEKEELQSALSLSTEKVHVQKSEIISLKTQYAQLELDLKSAREANNASTNPNVAEMENLHGEVRKLRVENAALEKKVSSYGTDLEYTRTQYQLASTAAVEASNRVERLEKDLEVMTIKAKGEAVRLAEVNNSEAVDQSNKRADRLQMELSRAESMLRRKEEEVRDMKRGRGGVVTRGSSVGVKSPRGGSRPGSPGPGSSGHGSKIGGSALRYG